MIYLLSIFLIAIIVFLARFNLFRLPQKGITVLLYHRISDDMSKTSLDKFSIPPSIFKKHLIYLKKKGFTSILPCEIEKIKKDKLWKDRKYVLITFDDGYKDNIEAARILKKHSMKGLFFISSAYIGKTMNSVEMLNSNDIKELVSYEMAIGSHSHNHIKLSQMGSNDIKSEISTSVNILSNFCRIEDFAYPFGDYDNRVIETLKKHRIKRAYIIGQKIYRPDKDFVHKIPRAIVRKNTTMLDFYLMITRGRARF